MSKKLFDWPIWSQLSSTTTSKVNTEIGGRSLRAARNRTVMTVSHDEGTQGVHVQLRREFRFVSPPAPETPVFAHPRRIGQLIEPIEIRDAPTEDEARAMDQDGRLVTREEKGKGKAVEKAVAKVASDMHAETEGLTTAGGNPEEQVDDTHPPINETMTTALGSAAQWPDEVKVTEETDDPDPMESKTLRSEALENEALESERRERTTTESQDHIEGASIAPTSRSQAKTREESVNDTQTV